MSESERYLEIVQLDNGDVVLQRPTPEGVTATADDALVRMRFSPEMLDVLGDDLLQVAEAMVEAAADALGELQAQEGEDAGERGFDLLQRKGKGPTLH
jgi:hypothetical protein